ncbi:MAG: M56 family metallopeptidase [Psychrosphaera sp.]|nr:M56 family metallopeptidase [Psychrosphaera sp.]
MIPELFIPEYWLTGLGSWGVSYLLHSTVILGVVLLLTHFGTFISESRKDVLLKMGLVAGILTASLQFVQSSNGAFVSTIVVDVAPVLTKTDNQVSSESRIISTKNLIMVVPEQMAAAPASQGGQRFTINWLNGLLACWLAGCVFFALRFVWLWQSFKRTIGKRTVLEHQPTIDLCRRLKDKMGINRQIVLTQSDQITSGMAIGLSQICIPHGLWLEVDEEQLTAIIAHELAHLSRIDPIWLFFWHLMSIVFFFQPFNKLTQLSFQSRAEFLADATAVRQTKDPVAMVNSLMSAAKLASRGSFSSLTSHLLGRNATIVERSRLLLAEKLVKTKTSVSFILIAATVIVVASALLLPSISLASREVGVDMAEQIKLTPANSQPWGTYQNTTLRFQTNLNYRESIAGKQIILQSRRVNFAHDLDGIARLGPFGELRFISRSIYGTRSLVISADWRGDAVYQFKAGDELIFDQQAANDFIRQLLDEGLGHSDVFKRKMLKMYIDPLPTTKKVSSYQLALEDLNRALVNQNGYYSSGDLVVVRAMLDSPQVFVDAEQEAKSQQRFFNAMAHSGAYMASVNDFGYLSISHKQQNNVQVATRYNLNNARLLDLFVKATGLTYVVGDSEKALVKFLVRLHFDVPPDGIKWLEE